MAQLVPLTIAQRSYVLEEEIHRFVARGYRVVSKTDVTAHLVKARRFSILWAFLSFLVLAVGLLVYLVYYITKGEDTLFLEVDPYGEVKYLVDETPDPQDNGR
jgi:uncharacterized BrkB/YihY/UPF0761 family membrane protein